MPLRADSHHHQSSSELRTKCCAGLTKIPACEKINACPSLRALPPECGPVAQLGARFHGMEEVVGSIPTRSTIFNYLQILRFSAWCHLVSQDQKYFRFH